LNIIHEAKDLLTAGLLEEELESKVKEILVSYLNEYNTADTLKRIQDDFSYVLGKNLSENKIKSYEVKDDDERLNVNIVLKNKKVIRLRITIGS
jgi:hypothetical protein